MNAIFTYNFVNKTIVGTKSAINRLFSRAEQPLLQRLTQNPVLRYLEPLWPQKDLLKTL